MKTLSALLENKVYKVASNLNSLKDKKEETQKKLFGILQRV